MMTVAQVATLRLGSPFRERIEHEPSGAFLVIQGKDISPDGTLLPGGMTRISTAPGKGRPDTLSPGELVFQTRGLSYRAAAVPADAPAMIAAGSLFILRPDPSRLTADYLTFFLNLPTTQAVLRQMATGSTIPNLRRAAIEQLELPVPSLPDQNRLVALSKLVRRQHTIENQLNALRLQELQLLATARAGCEIGGAKSTDSKRRQTRPPGSKMNTDF